MAQAATLTMQDIAALAHVTRPAVSMWRRRSRVRGRDIPFPPPVSVVDRIERFDRDAVVRWLEETGRGNNAEHAMDAPALSAPLDADRDVLLTLLALQVLSGEQLEGQTSDGLVALAERVDPDDRLLLREIRAWEARPALLAYVDELVEASYGPRDALSRLDSGRLRREAHTRGLADEAARTVATVLEGCRVHLGDGLGLAVSGTHRELADALPDYAWVLPDGDDAEARRLRRRALLTEREVAEPGAVAGVLRLASVVGLDDGEALRLVDETALELGPPDAAVVLGPASLLCDRLTGDAERDRAQTLRSARLVFAARLPRGLWKAAPRQSLAVWVMSGGVTTQRFKVADLAGVELDRSDLTSDVVGALELSESRAFRYARNADLAPVLAGGVVVPRGVRAPQLGTARTTDQVDRVRAATLATSSPLDGYDVLVEEAPGAVVLSRRSLGELRSAGQLELKRGSRIDAEHAHPAGTVRVVSAADPAGDGGLRLDPFDAERHYGRAVRTEPGDVVFAERPHPCAHVDEIGGAIVASPSRILRLARTAPIGPHALAAVINQQESGEWATWAVPVLPAGETGPLDAALAGIDVYLAELERRVAAARELRAALLDGVANGTVTLDLTDPTGSPTSRPTRHPTSDQRAG